MKLITMSVMYDNGQERFYDMRPVEELTKEEMQEAIEQIAAPIAEAFRPEGGRTHISVDDIRGIGLTLINPAKVASVHLYARED